MFINLLWIVVVVVIVGDIKCVFVFLFCCFLKFWLFVDV